MPILSEALFGFLEELKENNERPWFQANQARYERDVLEPALALIDALRPELHAVSPHFEAVAKKSGGSLFRIYRDTRFSRDKAPYKTHLGIQLRHEAGARDVHAPGFYLHLDPGECGVGAGLWHPEPDVLQRLRLRIGEDDGWTAVRAAIDATGFSWMGEATKRPPKGFPPDHRYVEDLKRKDLGVWRALTREEVVSDGLPATVGRIFAAAAPLMRFECQTLDLPF